MNASEWEIDTSEEAPSQKIYNPSDWEAVSEENEPSQGESLGYSAMMAIPRIGTDIAKSAYQGIQNLPNRFNQAQTEIPGAINTLIHHPIHATGQGLAGAAEFVNNLFNSPADISSYASNKLHLLPENINSFIQKFRTPENTENLINAWWGKPKYPGEELLRGLPRNAGSVAAIASFNPLNFLSTKNSIKNTLLKTHDALENRATQAFNDVSKQVNSRGIGQLPTGGTSNIDFNSMRSYFPSIKKYDKLITGAEYGDYNSLRKLQTDLYSEGKKNLGSSTEADRMKGAEMLEKRNDINQAISDHLNNTGNTDLSEKLQGARNDWRTLQQTYYNENMNNALVNMFNKDFRKVPKNLISILGEESNPMKNLLNFHPGLQSSINRYQLKKNILGKGLKIGIPSTAAYLGYEYGKGGNNTYNTKSE